MSMVVPSAEESLDTSNQLTSYEAGASGQETVTGTELVDLKAIYAPEVQLVTAPLRIPAQVSEHLSTAPANWGWRKVVSVDAEDKPDLACLRGLEASSAEGGDALRAVTAEFVELMAVLFGADAIGARLANAARPPCPRYHVDNVHVRGVLTLVGRGSDYLLAHEVDRTKLGHGANGLPDEESGLIAPGAEPRSLEGGLICLFKGNEWPSNSGKALVHRSPPEDGNPRWVLTLDLV